MGDFLHYRFVNFSNNRGDIWTRSMHWYSVSVFISVCQCCSCGSLPKSPAGGHAGGLSLSANPECAERTSQAAAATVIVRAPVLCRLSPGCSHGAPFPPLFSTPVLSAPLPLPSPFFPSHPRPSSHPCHFRNASLFSPITTITPCLTNAGVGRPQFAWRQAGLNDAVLGGAGVDAASMLQGTGTGVSGVFPSSVAAGAVDSRWR